MTPYTVTHLSNLLKETWTEDAFKKMFYLELQGAQRDMQRGYQRQIFNPGIKLAIERKTRQNEMMQLLAARQRGNKPSYRQRQKNGRAGRKK